MTKQQITVSNEIAINFTNINNKQMQQDILYSLGILNTPDEINNTEGE